LPGPISTADELVAVLAQTGIPWDERRWRNFLELGPDEQALEVRMLQDAGEPPPHDSWQDVVAVLTVAASVATIVGGIATGVGGVASAIGAIQSTLKGM
jgi:hypothetical protein